jgi:hypothetical protein
LLSAAEVQQLGQMYEQQIDLARDKLL